MIPSIKNKQDSMILMKIMNIYTNAVIQERTFISWDQLEKYLDIIIDNIQKSGHQYDVVVGIKTGGAIISDYISKKLNIQNYKIKLLRSEYNCDKKSTDTINDIIQKRILNNLGKYTICEGIDDNLQGKNVILIDELVSSGKTMIDTVKYLKQDKNVNIVYPTCIAFNKKMYKQNFKINYVFNGTVIVWPWGYDN
jgi:hypoxanthine phosphoribosyltransferase